MVEPSALASRFRTRFGGSPRLFRAPGRVNLIGEHTDYNDGLVMPMALDRRCWVAAGPRPDRLVIIHSEHSGETAAIAIDDYPRRTGTWRDYPAGVLAMLRSHGVPLQGAELLVTSDVPTGAGLSSSAALEVGVALALLDAADVSLPPTVIAQLCQRAENEVVGAHCGIMDQYVACHARAGTALLLDCRTTEHRLVPIPPDVRVVACNSMVRHSLSGGDYNRRRRECLAAVATLASRHRQITSLRDITVACLDDLRPELDDVLFRRVRHIVTENARVEQIAIACAKGRLDALAGLMAESHRSMRDDYEISCAEIDALVEIASAIPGVHGARLTGGGFGGCTVNLVDRDAVADFVREVSSQYESRTGLRPETYVSAASEGAGRVDPESES